jgi:hypothetical protein
MLAVRRWLLALGICAAIGCGLDAVGTMELPAAPGAEVGLESSVPDLDASLDVSTDAPFDNGLPGDAEADRPDAGVVFVPSHIQPAYSLTAPNVTIATNSVLDTSARTITIGSGAPAPLTNLVHSGEVAVWSVGSFKLDFSVKLTLKGTRALVIVASKDVNLDGHIAAFGDKDVPGPGGSAAASGAGKGGNGVKPNSGDASGGGGAGHATAGGAGGTKGAAAGGAGGAAVNANDAVLAGGSGGGHGGGLPTAKCSDATRGRGGVGGGAIQISALGKLIVSTTGSIDVGGGGGAGGCKDNGMDQYRGGGGGGAGGLVVFEAIAGIQIDFGAQIAAAGGGGGEGGSSKDMGGDGQSGPYPAGIALGGALNSGGKGGNGGTGAGSSATMPDPGVANDSAGGGGGSTGRVFLGTRSPSAILVFGTVAALRTDFAF